MTFLHEYQIRRTTFTSNIFYINNFQKTLFSESVPTFYWLAIISIYKIEKYPSSMLILMKKISLILDSAARNSITQQPTTKKKFQSHILSLITKFSTTIHAFIFVVILMGPFKLQLFSKGIYISNLYLLGICGA